MHGEDVKSKKVTHSAQHEDDIYHKVMFMTEAAFELHVGDLEILKPESSNKRLPCGTTTLGYSRGTGRTWSAKKACPW